MDSKKLLGLELLIGGASWVLAVIVFIVLKYPFGQVWYVSFGVAFGIWFILQVATQVIATIEHSKAKRKRKSEDFSVEP